MRLIDADALNFDGLGICEVMEALMEAPTIEPKHGEWIPVTNGRGGHECSVCHEYAPSRQSGCDHLSTFCPNCGACMSGADMGREGEG